LFKGIFPGFADRAFPLIGEVFKKRFLFTLFLEPSAGRTPPEVEIFALNLQLDDCPSLFDPSSRPGG